MNVIRVKRLILSGFITLVVFIFVELVIESILGEAIFGNAINKWHHELGIQNWGAENNILNLLIALLNTTMLIWLYAALRPMFGVGAKTALITSLFGFVFATAFAINSVNIGIYPWWIALLEKGYLLIELPVSIIVGAQFYEDN